MSRFFIEQSDVSSDRIIISGEDVKHIKNVLRLASGSKITLSDGNGKEYFVELDKFDKNSISANIIRVEENRTEPPVDVTLFQGIPKSDKMDFIIQKSVELGIKRIVPVFTERTVVRLDSQKAVESKVSRWQRISLEAAKQCNRGMIPQIEQPMGYAEALKLAKDSELCIIPYEKEEKSGLKKYIANNKAISVISVFIGPEGGFSEEEVEKAVVAGVVPVTLGPRIMRTETAGIAVLSILMYELGDVGT